MDVGRKKGDGGASKTHKTPRAPKYRRHSSGRFAFVEIAGERRRLPGAYGSTESKQAYYRLLTTMMQSAVAAPPPSGRSVLVRHLCEQYLIWAVGYYADSNGKPATEYGHLQYAVTALLSRHRTTPVAEFGPIALKEIRQAMVDGTWSMEEHGEKRPWTRAHVNRQIGRLRRVFRWGSENELVPAGVVESLASIAPLRKGKCSATEAPPIVPVEERHVLALLPWLTPTVRAMVEIQRLTGMRSQSVCFMRPGDILREEEEEKTEAGAVVEVDAGEEEDEGKGGDGDGNDGEDRIQIWSYVPGFLESDPQHKSAWRDKTLTIALGPRCQKILAPFLENRQPDQFIFNPIESEAWRHAQRRDAAKTRTSKGANRESQPPRRWLLNDCYTPRTYWHALNYAFKRAAKAKVKIERWHPHQLRHNMATRIRGEYGIEAARVYLGHDDANATEIYAERDLELARRIASEIG